MFYFIHLIRALFYNCFLALLSALAKIATNQLMLSVNISPNQHRGDFINEKSFLFE